MPVQILSGKAYYVVAERAAEKEVSFPPPPSPPLRRPRLVLKVHFLADDGGRSGESITGVLK